MRELDKMKAALGSLSVAERTRIDFVSPKAGSLLDDLAELIDHAMTWERSASRVDPLTTYPELDGMGHDVLLLQTRGYPLQAKHFKALIESYRSALAQIDTLANIAASQARQINSYRDESAVLIREIAGDDPVKKKALEGRMKMRVRARAKGG